MTRDTNTQAIQYKSPNTKLKEWWPLPATGQEMTHSEHIAIVIHITMETLGHCLFLLSTDLSDKQ